jgi:hypothetical protein
MQSDVKSAAEAQGETAQAKPPMFIKRIGSTVYRVSIHFSESSTETTEDKILRLMKSEVRDIV